MSISYQIDPPKRGFFEVLAILIAGAAGVASALMADFVQKGESSALFVVGAMSSQHLALNLPPIYIATFLMISGAIAVFIFEPQNKKSAFYTGASILAVLWAGMPGQNVEGVAPEIVDEAVSYFEEDTTPSGDPVAFMSRADCQQTGPIISVAYAHDCVAANQTTDWQRYLHFAQANNRIPLIVRVTIPTHSALPKISTRLYDKVSGRHFDLSAIGKAKRVSNGYQVIYATTVNTRDAARAHLFVRVEADGYKIGQGEKVVSRIYPTEIPVALETSTTPLWLQRMRTPRKF